MFCDPKTKGANLSLKNIIEGGDFKTNLRFCPANSKMSHPLVDDGWVGKFIKAIANGTLHAIAKTSVDESIPPLLPDTIRGDNYLVPTPEEVREMCSYRRAKEEVSSSGRPQRKRSNLRRKTD